MKKLNNPLWTCSVIMILLTGCVRDKAEPTVSIAEKHPIIGTWKLISGTIIQDGDTSVTDYTRGQEMIKIINETHFAFLRHDTNTPDDSSELFVAGGGTYTLEGNIYTEHLEYFTLREWEGNHFSLEFTISGDTLITKGVEEVEELNVSYFNIEKYCRVSK